MENNCCHYCTNIERLKSNDHKIDISTTINLINGLKMKKKKIASQGKLRSDMESKFSFLLMNLRKREREREREAIVSGKALQKPTQRSNNKEDEIGDIPYKFE